MFSAHFEQINIMHILFTYMEIYIHIFLVWVPSKYRRDWEECEYTKLSCHSFDVTLNLGRQGKCKSKRADSRERERWTQAWLGLWVAWFHLRLGCYPTKVLFNNDKKGLLWNDELWEMHHTSSYIINTYICICIVFTFTNFLNVILLRILLYRTYIFFS